MEGVVLGRYSKILTLALMLLFQSADTCIAGPAGNGQEPSPDGNMARELKLEVAGRIALSRNPSIAAALESVRQARERVVQARAAWWPTLDASASASRVRLSNREQGQQGWPDNPENFYQNQLLATWVLFDGFERQFAEQGAGFDEMARRAAWRDTRRLLLSLTAAHFYDAQLARERIRIAEANQSFYLKKTREARERRLAGAGSLSDEINLTVQVNAAQNDLIGVRQDYETALSALAGIMGMPEAAFPPDMVLAALEKESRLETMLPDIDALLAIARQKRPDIMERRYAMDVAGRNVEIARAKFYPAVRIRASIDGARPEDARFDRDDCGDSVILVLSYNLFSGGIDRARLREAEHARIAAQKTLQSTTTAISAEVRQAFSMFKSARDRLALQRTNADLVRRNRDLVENEYEAGQGSLVRLNEAQRDLTAADGHLAAALASMRYARCNLMVVTGEILDDYADIGL